MNINWKWIVGIVLVLVALIVAPLAWQIFLPTSAGYGMMQGYRIPMMNGGFGMMPPIGMWIMWLMPLSAFVLIGFAFGWAANQFTRRRD